MSAFLRTARRALTAALLLPAALAFAQQDGTLDTSFDPGQGFAGQAPFVSALAIQPDGKVIVGGDFTLFNSTGRARIARLNADGSLDASFDPGTGFTSLSDPRLVACLALQPDGKVIVGGSYTSFNGRPRLDLARLNADGSLDVTFDTAMRAGVAFSLALQPDGKVIVGGDFDTFDGAPHSRILRLNANGTVDASFNPNADIINAVTSLALQPDGKVLAGGYFPAFGGVGYGIARLNADGSPDASFQAGTGFDRNNGNLYLALQPDGKIVAGGSFISYQGQPVHHIARLLADGRLDTTFHTGTGFTSTNFFDVSSLAIQPDGKILVGGYFGSYNGTARSSIARLNADGTLDTGFDPGAGFGPAGSTVSALALQPDGRLIAGGSFNTFDGTGRNLIARLHAYPAAAAAQPLQERALTLYPNPAGQRATLTAPGPVKAVRLLDAAGRQVLALPGITNSAVLELGDLPPGLYLVEAESAAGPTLRSRLILTR